MKVIFESSNTKEPRIISGDPMKFFVGNKLVNGQFVSVGYLIPQKDPNADKYSPDGSGVPTFGARTRKVNIPTNDTEMQAYIQKYADTPFGDALIAIRMSPKYQAVLKSGDDNKAVPFDLAGCTLIKIGRYNLNWRNHELNAADWSKRGDAVMKLRHKYGFGDFGNWTEDSWHNKPEYKGTGLYPKIDSMPDEGRRWPDQPADDEMTQDDMIEFGRRGRYDGKVDKQAAKYSPVMGDLYMDCNSRIAIRQNLAYSGFGKSFYYFVSENGEMQEIDSECIHWLHSAYKKVPAAKAPEIAQMEADEAEYVKELAKLERYDAEQIKTLVLDRVLYMVGNIVTPSGAKERIAYVNDVDVYRYYPYLDRNEMHNVLPDWIKESTRDIIEMEKEAAAGINESALPSTENPADATTLWDFMRMYLNIDDNMSWSDADIKMRDAIAETAKPADMNSIMKLMYAPQFNVEVTEDNGATYYEVTVGSRTETYYLWFTV